MRRRTLVGLVSSGAALALVVGASIVWPGLDAQETPKVDTSVWALQTGDGRRYARVNTTINELDTVRRISNPSEVVQTGGNAYVYSDGYSRLTPIDPAMPIDLDEETLRASASTPPGTTDVATAGDFVAYRTDGGILFTGRLSDGSAGQLDPFASDNPEESASPTPTPTEGADGVEGEAAEEEQEPPYTADAIALDDRGYLFAYSSSDGAMLTYDLVGSRVVSRDELVIEDLTLPVVSAAGDDWAVIDGEDGAVWMRGADEAIETDTTGALVVSEPDAEGDAVYLAGETSLVKIPTDGTPAEIEVGGATTVLGVPARPVVHDGAVYAAWLAPAATQGVMWDSRSGEERVLSYADESIGDDPRPVLVSSDSALILNETRSGWVWTAPSGALVPSSQDWTLDERENPVAQESDEQLAVVIDPKPPVAVADAFGVRPGSLATLPVLLNDHDPNEDVLSIDASSVSGLDPDFGTISITDDGQRFAVRTAPDASGSATFSYAIVDGTAQDGLRSSEATVTLTAVADDASTPPAWCGVTGCLAEWPEPEVAPGGTVTVPVLPGWVDPEGDPLLLLSVTNTSGVGSVAATPDGDVVYQHANSGAGGDQLVQLEVTVSDARGETATKPLVVRVLPQPELSVQSFALVDTTDTGLTVDVSPHVTGTAGAMSLESVQVLDDAPATATLVGGTTTFDFAPTRPGVYRVSFTVTDGQSQATGTAKITIVAADAPAQLATPPVVAFVRPQQDVTLDVFDVVSNPTRRVLLLSDVTAVAEGGAKLSVDSVSQSHLRVSGSTVSGDPGRLGTVTYTVSDGTDDSGASIQGEATVYLLPEAPELAPIAVDDAVVVRAGSQIDIPVLDNDISPSGGAPLLNPASVVSSSDKALAFASGDVVRYLAPTEPGTYGIEYTVYTAGSPGLVDTASVRVQVLDDDLNRAPVPETLEGRVLSGQATAIEFDGFGMDPDGDVVTLDRIVSQPESGSATISADGSSLVYASVPGHRGQVSFRYRVVDAQGETGEGTVRVGVLDAQSNPSPVTFTDYIQVQAGAESSIRIRPLANDIDPTGGVLSLTDVRPDLPEKDGDGADSADFLRVEERISAWTEQEVVVTAGTEPGTMSFLYDVTSTSGNTGRGLIVVKIVRESVPDYPIVTDTVLTVETRDSFAEGVSVLDGKVAWSGGDPATLQLGLWGSPADVDVVGDTLQGALPKNARTIAFTVSGGTPEKPVQTYAFLRIPGEEDVSLALRAGISPIQVDELDSATFDMSDLVAYPSDRVLEVGSSDDLRTSGARGEASCTRESGTTLRYTAGGGAPWTDACLVPVRIEGQDDWTVLSVPIAITAKDPQPILRPASITVDPGQTYTYDLRDLTTWELREDWDAVRYGIDYQGGFFSVSLSGSIVTVVGDDKAPAGGEEFATISVTSHDAVAPARLILRVGSVPSTLPQGGEVAQQCTQASGTSCTIDVLGAAGEVNPLPRTPLRLVGAQTAGACEGISVDVVDSVVRASWAAETPGTTCAISFSVEDAQGRRSASERNGRILLDLHGYPKNPSSVVQTAYGDGTFTLRVDPGEASMAYPALTGFVVRSEGVTVAECPASGACAPIAGVNGEQLTYEVTAKNSVGESPVAVSTVAWAYNPPAAPAKVTVRPLVTSGEGQMVSLEITGVEAAETGTLTVTSATGDEITVPVAVGKSTVTVPSYRIGTNKATAVTVTPYSRFALPAGLGGDLMGGSRTGMGNGVGAPQNQTLTLSSTPGPNGLASVTAKAAADVNGDGSALRYGVVREGQQCVASSSSPSFSFADLPDGQEYRFTLCVESRIGERSYGRVGADGTVRAAQLRNPPKLWTFRIASTPVLIDGEGRAEWRIREQPTSTETPPRNNRVDFNTEPQGSSVIGRDPGLQVRYVHNEWGDETPWAPITPAKGSAPYQLQAAWSLGVCKGDGVLELRDAASSTPQGTATFSWDDSKIRFFNKDGKALKYAGGWKVPVGATSVEGVRVTASWEQGWNLAPATAVLARNCDPNNPPPPPKPTPTPTPKPTKTPPPAEPDSEPNAPAEGEQVEGELTP